MKRSFRVATVFTGAAACAAVAAPAAQAAPLTTGATARVAPDTTGAACQGTGPTDSLVLYYTGNHGPACFQGTGTPAIVGGDPLFKSYCAGEYKGYLWIGGTRHDFTAGGHTLNQHVSKVSITGINSRPGLCTL
jgi:hypothetical protein